MNLISISYLVPQWGLERYLSLLGLYLKYNVAVLLFSSMLRGEMLGYGKVNGYIRVYLKP